MGTNIVNICQNCQKNSEMKSRVVGDSKRESDRVAAQMAVICKRESGENALGDSCDDRKDYIRNVHTRAEISMIASSQPKPEQQ